MNIKHPLHSIFIKWKILQSILILKNDKKSNLSPLLAKTLQETLSKTASVEEKKWIEQIESIRKNLNNSLEEITIEDYGAGAPNIQLSENEMYDGKTVKRVVGDVCRKASKPYFWSFLLFKIIRTFKPSTCLELGTCLGISASYQAAALKMNQTGKIVTMEGAKSLAAIAQKNFQALTLDNVIVIQGRFQDTLPETLQKYGHFDYVFIDGHHDEQATLLYFESIFPFLKKKAILVFDDISWSSGMKRAWNLIKKDTKVNMAVDLWAIGICIIYKS